MNDTKPLLLPMPRTLRWTGGTCAHPDQRTITQEDNLAPEAYRLRIAPEGIYIASADPAGLRHAQATLSQLTTQGPLPCADIEDAPSFAVRGLMLDCSRDRIPTRAELSRLIQQMAAWKMNHLQLYSEHAVVYPGHESVAPADGITLDELADISAEAKAVGIELAGNQNCFGHLERWFQHARYEPLAEIPGVLSSTPGDVTHHHRCGCRSLAPAVAAARALPKEWIAHQCAVLDAPIFNIGGDETWDLGKGRSAELVSQIGYAAVYGNFLAELMQATRSHGKTAAFWADIVLNHPEAASCLDHESIALDWGYESTYDFAASQKKLAAAGFSRRWVCAGSNCWSTWAGYSDQRRGNLLRAAKEGKAAGAEGLLLTVWGDGGHRQIWPADLAGIAEAAHRAWSGAEIAYEPLAGGLFAFGNANMGPWLDRLGQVDASLRNGMRQESAYQAFHGSINCHPLVPWVHRNGPSVTPGTTAPSEWQAVVTSCGELLTTLPGKISKQVADESTHAINLMVLGAERGCEMSGGPARPKDWAPRYDFAIAEHQRLWHLRSRQGGLDHSTAAFKEPLG